MMRPKRFDVLDLTRFITIGMTAMLVACTADPAGEEATAALASGSGSGSGSDAGCYVPTRLDLTLDRSAISTELATSSTIIVAMTGSGGFGGTVTLSAGISDPYGNPLPGWAIALDRTIVAVPPNGTAIAVATVAIPSENHGLVGTARFAVTSSAATGTFAATASVTALNQITFPIAIANGLCIYPAPSTLNVTIGTKLRWLNNPTNTSNLSIHTDANTNGIYHQATDPGSAPGQIYETTVTGTPSTSVRWYCHSPGPTANNFIQPVN